MINTCSLLIVFWCCEEGEQEERERRRKIKGGGREWREEGGGRKGREEKATCLLYTLVEGGDPLLIWGVLLVGKKAGVRFFGQLSIPANTHT